MERRMIHRRNALAPSERRSKHRLQLRVEELEPRNLLSVYTPVQIRHAYGFDTISFLTNAADPNYYNSHAGQGETIAIVDAYDDPNIAADLKVFDRQFGLPDPVLVKATPEGTPAVNAGWAGEIALDVE